MNFWSDDTMSKVVTLGQYVEYNGTAGRWWKASNYKIKSMTHPKLIEEIRMIAHDKLFIALRSDENKPKDANKILLTDLHATLSNLLSTKNAIDKNIKRYDKILKSRDVSIYSALVQAFEPTKISIEYENLRTALIKENQEAESLMQWSEYKDKGYDNFFKQVKKLLPEGDHSKFYHKQIQESVNRPKQVSAATSSSNGVVSPSPSIQPKSSKESNAKPMPDIPKQTPPKNEKTKADGHKPISAVEPSRATAPNPPPKAIISQKPSITSELELKVELESAIPEETIHGTIEKDADDREPKPDIELEPVIAKETLLEKMARQAKDRESTSNKKTQKTVKDKGPISYPIVFKARAWKKYWSNSNAPIGKLWCGYLWNCASIGKSYLMNDAPREKLIRQFDVNQDFVVVKHIGKKLHILMFDGVSQSRAPRQWAEFLAEVYVEKKMNIEKLKKHSEEVENWHQNALLRWEKWVEEEYLPKRTHLPSWRLKNEVKTSHTTFIAIEINKESIRIANIGDSAVFCKQNSGEIKHLPATYNHLLGPKNISTEKLYDQSDIEYLSLQSNDLNSLLACTDSIADYIFDENPQALDKKYTESLNALSSKGDKFAYMAEMISKGPSNGGWLEDDVSFFSLVNSIVKGGEQ